MHRARLLKKLEYVGAQGQTLKWIQSFLHGWTQRVVVGGVASEPSTVLAKVPQVTVSSTKLFADDLILYWKITSENDRDILKDDLTKLTVWE